MKVLLSIMSLIGLLTITISCERNSQRQEDFRREKPIKEDDIREDDSFKRSLPVEKQEADPSIEIMEFETDSETD